MALRPHSVTLTITPENQDSLKTIGEGSMTRGLDRVLTERKNTYKMSPSQKESDSDITKALNEFAEQEPLLSVKPVAIPSTMTTPKTEDEMIEEKIRLLPTAEERGNARRAAREAKAAKTLTLDEED